ncbi:hypothetical protein HN748_04885 [Candidatus Peregrinibacteria bacterium]|jgi:hypothetical protein|nr:hypothetical protein [Candidatus Peregrinibacteria bacterium]MBT7484542.1 hypothetical protein [Candidatus Peregrinibacteria bacterium]MBT7703545.1 hypothetical protein [Candidatus Peregrinibacteria bacterium]
MFNHMKRVFAALIVAMFILPHFALAATMQPTTAACADGSYDPCTVNGSTSVNHALYVDNNDTTGEHIFGPNYNIVMTLDLGTSYTVTALEILQVNGSSTNHIAPTGTNASNTVDYSTNNVDWTSFGSIPAYGTDDVTISRAGVSARYLRVTNAGNKNPGAGWQPTDFTVTYIASTAPEMGVWALLVILPIMFFVVYKSKPELFRPTAA